VNYRQAIQKTFLGNKARNGEVPTLDQELDKPTVGIIVGDAGDLSVRLSEMEAGENVVIPVTAGIVYPFEVVEIYSADTTAANIIVFH